MVEEARALVGGVVAGGGSSGSGDGAGAVGSDWQVLIWAGGAGQGAGAGGREVWLHAACRESAAHVLEDAAHRAALVLHLISSDLIRCWFDRISAVFIRCRLECPYFVVSVVMRPYYDRMLSDEILCDLVGCGCRVTGRGHMDVNRISGYIPGKIVFFLMQVPPPAAVGVACGTCCGACCGVCCGVPPG